MRRSIFTKIPGLFALLFAGQMLHAQQVDSIYFHLYTDSLKKGTHNYINVDGKRSDGSWQPLTSKELNLSSNACSFEGNDLVIPPSFNGESITVKAQLKSNPSVWKERTIWIKLLPDPEILPTKDDGQQPKQRRRRS